MVKRIFVACLLASALNADVLENTIASFMGDTEFYSQKNLVKIVFNNPSSYVDEVTGKPNALEIIKTLKDNGLIRLFYKEAQMLELTFHASTEPLLFMRVINESLEAMGYSYYLSQKVARNGEGVTWTISLSTQHVVDPVMLSKQLEARGCSIGDIVKEGKNAWYYVLDTANAGVKVEALALDTTVALGKPIKPYWVAIKEARRLSLRAHPADHWFPQVAFFDERLHLIEEIRLEENHTKLKLTVPNKAMYVKIEDRYTLDNIKRGLSIYLNSRR